MRRSPISPSLLCIPAAALLAVLPLVLHGCSCGHDFDFHLISWMEAAAQFKSGNLHPAWAFSPAWNAGEPRFVFYPPLSWTLGAILGLFLQWSSAPIVYTWIALTSSGFAMYFLARTLRAGFTASTFAAIVYLANPYMLFTAYERTAYAELLAAAWIPLLLAALLRERVTPLRIAIPVALLWLTNAPAAVMGCYSLAVLAVLRIFWVWFDGRSASTGIDKKACLALAGNIVTGLLLGLGLASFYIVPAAYERRCVQIAMATIEGMRIQDNFLFHHTADALHDEVLHTASLIAIALLAAVVIVFATILWHTAPQDKTRNTRQHTASMAVLALLIGILLTPVSAIVWRIGPELTFLQFPWRLTAILAAILCAGIGILAAHVAPRARSLGLTAALIVPCLIWPSVRAFTQPCDEEDNVSARLAVFNRQMGTDPTDEYTTGNSDNDSLAHSNPPFWLTEDGNAAAPVGTQQPGPAPTHLAVQSSGQSVLVLNLRDYPSWLVRVNGAVVEQRVDRADGLIAVPLHAGRSDIDISYAMTRDRKLGDGLSLAALCIAIAFASHRRRHPAVEPVS
jgi:hypothetical protein